MARDFYRTLVSLLTEAKFSLARSAKGSHEVWQHSNTGKKVIVPRNLKSRHTANAILKSAGIGKKL